MNYLNLNVSLYLCVCWMWLKCLCVLCLCLWMCMMFWCCVGFVVWWVWVNEWRNGVWCGLLCCCCLLRVCWDCLEVLLRCEMCVMMGDGVNFDGVWCGWVWWIDVSVWWGWCGMGWVGCVGWDFEVRTRGGRSSDDDDWMFWWWDWWNVCECGEFCRCVVCNWWMWWRCGCSWISWGNIRAWWIVLRRFTSRKAWGRFGRGWMCLWCICVLSICCEWVWMWFFRWCWGMRRGNWWWVSVWRRGSARASSRRCVSWFRLRWWRFVCSNKRGVWIWSIKVCYMLCEWLWRKRVWWWCGMVWGWLSRETEWIKCVCLSLRRTSIYFCGGNMMVMVWCCIWCNF